MSTGIPNVNPSTTSGSTEPSQLKGHAKYMKGVANETIGNMINSPDWQQSGARDKTEAVSEMRAAKENTDPVRHQTEYQQRNPGTLKTEGSVEQKLGQALGCGGMEERGGEKMQAAASRDKTL